MSYVRTSVLQNNKLYVYVCHLCFCVRICVSATLLALCKRSPTRLRLIALFWNVRESVEDNDHVDLMDHNAFDYGPHNMGACPCAWAISLTYIEIAREQKFCAENYRRHFPGGLHYRHFPGYLRRDIPKCTDSKMAMCPPPQFREHTKQIGLCSW